MPDCKMASFWIRMSFLQNVDLFFLLWIIFFLNRGRILVQAMSRQICEEQEAKAILEATEIFKRAVKMKCGFCGIEYAISDEFPVSFRFKDYQCNKCQITRNRCRCCYLQTICHACPKTWVQSSSFVNLK